VKHAVIPSADERFLRLTRNEQVRKRRRNRTLLRGATWVGLHLIVAGVVGAAAWGGHHYLTHSERFSVHQVLVSGASAAPAVQIKQVTDRTLGQNIFAADLVDLQHKLEAQPWIKVVSVKRRIPDALLIQIEERVPEVLVKIGTTVFLADGEGILLDRFGPQYADYDFPILTGLDGFGRETLRKKIQLGAAFVNFLYRSRPALGDQVSEIGLGGDDLEVMLNDGGAPLRIRPEAFDLNLDNYLAVRNYIGANYGQVRYVDLRWKDRITILPAEKRSTQHGAK
jgi:POTRA domain-containing FtsQ-type protein